MYRNILSAFKAEVGLLEWMDVRTKKRALDKANRVEGYIGFPAWLKDPVAVDAFYAALRFNNSSFFRNILTMVTKIYILTNFGNLFSIISYLLTVDEVDRGEGVARIRGSRGSLMDVGLTSRSGCILRRREERDQYGIIIFL